jgi:hypothetical protein
LAEWAPKVSAIGIHWLRGYETFSHIEAQPGVWDWTSANAEVGTAGANGMNVSGLLFYGTPWISAPAVFPTADLGAWSDYVSHTVIHARGKVSHWEVWNEPPNYTNKLGTPANYARLVIAAYDAAHAADPNCQVAMAAQSNNVNWLDQTLAAGATDHFDYITLHPYEMLAVVDQGWEAEFMSMVPTVRKMLAARDPARADAPIWFTEIGAAVGTGQGLAKVTAASQADDLVKAYTMALAQGVTRIDWFEGRDGDSGPFGLLDPSGAARPAYRAFTHLILQLGPQPHYIGWVLLNGKDDGFVFQGSSSAVLVAWAPAGLQDNVAFGQAVQVMSPVSGAISSESRVTLTKSPVFINQVPAALVAQAQANETLPFPWGGDYSRSPSVSIALAAANVEHGLHQLDAESKSDPTMVDGVAARDCAKSSRQFFTVDPNFLSYSAEPIRISAVIRRHPESWKAGFNLKYESVSGWKSTGTWTAVPGGDDWSTVNWTINDPQFVGKWAYNFAFDSDIKLFSGYYLKSVTVTKLPRETQ